MARKRLPWNLYFNRPLIVIGQQAMKAVRRCHGTTTAPINGSQEAHGIYYLNLGLDRRDSSLEVHIGAAPAHLTIVGACRSACGFAICA